MSALREQYSLLGKFLRSGFGKTVSLCAKGMLAAVVFGVFAAFFYPGVIETALDSFAAMVEDAGIMNEDGSISVFALLFNNWWAMLISAAYGFIPFIFLPILSLISNGLILGVFGAFYVQNDLGILAYLAGILPHGIFELPALVLSIACGVALCSNMNRMITGNPNRVPMVELLSDLLRVILLLVAPMVVAAAFIECFITPLILSLFL